MNGQNSNYTPVERVLMKVKEYRGLLGVGVIAILLAVGMGQIPQAPPWLVDLTAAFATAYVVFGVPVFIGAVRLVKWIRDYRYIPVQEVDSNRNFRCEPWEVPP
jgi:hypothetical protein